MDVKKLKNLFESGKITVQQLLDKDIVDSVSVETTKEEKTNDIRNFFLTSDKKVCEKVSDLSVEITEALQRQAKVNQLRPDQRWRKTRAHIKKTINKVCAQATKRK